MKTLNKFTLTILINLVFVMALVAQSIPEDVQKQLTEYENQIEKYKSENFGGTIALTAASVNTVRELSFTAIM